MPTRTDQPQFAQALVERARSEGVELIGPGGLLTGLTKTLLETALEVSSGPARPERGTRCGAFSSPEPNELSRLGLPAIRHPPAPLTAQALLIG
jgi:hypothetical protein